MEDLPTRPRNHEIQTLSERYFESLIPVSWVINPFRMDYGTDYNCEIAINSKVTGRNFSVQLKGKETDGNKNYISVNLKRTTINRWLNRLEPTMIVAYVVDEREAYWMWFENDTADLTLPKETYSIKVDRKNKLSGIHWDGIAEYFGQIFSKKYLLYTLPEVTDHNKQAWDLYFKFKFHEALPVFYGLLKAKPDDVSILEAIALSEYHLFNYQKALSYINKALAIEQNESLYANKASILTEQGFSQNDTGKINEAISIYNKLIEKNPSSATLFYNLGSALTKIEQYEQSIMYFKKSLELNPNKPEAWNNLGNAYMLISEHLLELECYNKALMVQPDMPETLFSKGSSLFRYFGKVDKGLALMLKSATLTDRHELDNPNFFFWVAEAYLAKSDYKNSKTWNDNGLSFFSTNDYLLHQQQRIELKQPI